MATELIEINPDITIDPAVCHGAAVISGTRIPVSLIVGSLGGGMTREEVMQEYDVTMSQIDSALTYAAEVVAHTIDMPLVPA